MRDLKAIGVSIYFEKENIDTGKMSSEMILTILASVAQMESESISKNLQMGILFKIKSGTYLQPSLPYSYEYNENREPVIIKSQALVVQRIFKDYLNGKGVAFIANQLNEEKVPLRNEKWWNNTVSYILKNSFYTGSVLWQKEYTSGYLGSKRVLNKGEKDKHMVLNHHISIISKDDFEMVQTLLNSRKGSTKYKPHAFSRKLYCPHCGKSLHQKFNRDKSAKWLCRTRFEKAQNCRLPIVAEKDLTDKLYALFSYLTENKQATLLPLLNDYKAISSKSNNTEIAEIYSQIQDLNEQAVIFAELKVQDIVTEQTYQEEIGKIQHQILKHKNQKNKITSNSEIEKKVDALDSLLDFINEWSGQETLPQLLEYVDFINIELDESLIVHFKNLMPVRW